MHGNHICLWYSYIIALSMGIWKYGGYIFICHPGLKILFIRISTHSFNLTLCFWSKFRYHVTHLEICRCVSLRVYTTIVSHPKRLFLYYIPTSMAVKDRPVLVKMPWSRRSSCLWWVKWRSRFGKSWAVPQEAKQLLWPVIPLIGV